MSKTSRNTDDIWKNNVDKIVSNRRKESYVDG